LEAVMARITSDLSSLSAEGMALTSVEVDIPSNRVVVGVSGSPLAAAGSLANSYGNAVYVDPSAPVPTAATCTISNCGNPLKGGLGIQASYGGTNYYCTSGYFQKIGSTLYMVTAGHCLEAGTGIPWYHTSLIGYSALFQTAGTADAGFITSSETGAKNEVLAYIEDVHPTHTIKNIAGWVAGTSQVVGSTVCKAGLISGWTCGKLLHVDITAGSRTHLNEASDESYVGDSGGTVMDGSTRLYGEVSLTDSSGDTWYVAPDRVDNFFGGRPCITTGC
jgi:hypothetical protein